MPPGFATSQCYNVNSSSSAIDTPNLVATFLMSDHHKSQLSAPFPPLTSSNFGLRRQATLEQRGRSGGEPTLRRFATTPRPTLASAPSHRLAMMGTPIDAH